MKCILLTRDKVQALDLVSHYTLLCNIVFYHYLSSYKVVEMINYDLELIDDLQREVMIVVHYDNDELLDYVQEYYEHRGIEVVVV